MEDPDQVTFTDDEIEMDEDLEALLYSQIHHKYDYELQADGSQNADRLQATACSSNHTEQHVFSVKSFSSEEHSTKSNHFQDSQKPVFDGFGSAGDIINVSDSCDESVMEISSSSKKSRGEDSSAVKSSEHDSGLHTWSSLSSVNCDPDVVHQVPKQRNDMPKSVQIAGTGRTGRETTDKTSLPDIICLDDSVPFSKDTLPDIICLDDSVPFSKDSKSKLKSKPKFDLEVELGIPKQQRKPKQSDSEIDTITIKPKAKKIPKAESFLKFDGYEVDLPVKSTPEEDYKKPLRQILTSHSVSKKVKLNLKKTFVVHSDSSSSSSGEDNSACSSRTTSDSDPDVEVCDAKSKSKKSEHSAKLDLNWNVNSTDCQTIKIIEKKRTQGDESSKWRIDKADLIGSQMSRSRYYTKREITCNNCNKQGHLSKRCPEPKKKTNCGLCGESGHMMSRCVNRLCFNCHLPGHTGARCSAPRRDRFAKCPRCLMKGHSEDQCPDQWRQFHSTTTAAEDLVPVKDYMNSRVWCSNCAKRGHFVHECRFPLMEKIVFPTCPFIIRYDMASSTRSRNVPAGGNRTQSRGRHIKFTSDSELDDSRRCKKLKSSWSHDTYTRQASSSKHDRTSDHQNVSTSHWLRSADKDQSGPVYSKHVQTGDHQNVSTSHWLSSADKDQSRPVYSQNLFPRGRSDKFSSNTLPRQHRYFQQEESNISHARQNSRGRWQDSQGISASKRHACLGFEDLSFNSKKPRIDSEISAENYPKKKAKPNKKQRKKLRSKLGIVPEGPTLNKKQRRKLRLEKRKANQDLSPAKDKTLSRKQVKKLQLDKERPDKNLSQNAAAAGLLRKGKEKSPKRPGMNGGRHEESVQRAESRPSKKKKEKEVQSQRLKSPSQLVKTLGKKKQNKKEGPKRPSIEMTEGRHQSKTSKRVQIGGLIPQCMSKSITTMSGFRSTFLASTSLK